MIKAYHSPGHKMTIPNFGKLFKRKAAIKSKEPSFSGSSFDFGSQINLEAAYRTNPEFLILGSIASAFQVETPGKAFLKKKPGTNFDGKSGTDFLAEKSGKILADFSTAAAVKP